jgi:hypothetical protein
VEGGGGGGATGSLGVAGEVDTVCPAGIDAPGDSTESAVSWLRSQAP